MGGWCNLPRPLLAQISMFFVKMQERCFMPHQQKSSWIFALGEKGLDLAAVGFVQVCITKASFRQSNFLCRAILLPSDYINNHVFFSRLQVKALELLCSCRTTTSSHSPSETFGFCPPTHFFLVTFTAFNK